MPSAEIITIGTEILLGEIIDTNARYLARALRDTGIDLYRKTSVGDNAKRIAQAIQQALERCDIIITTGGLGPTIDDPTREAVALAVGVQSEFRPELWEQIQQRFTRFGRPPTENNKRQAYVPQGAIAIENPVGTAPIFIVEQGEKVIISLPGVPQEMEHLVQHEIIPFLRQRFNIHSFIKARVLHTSGAGESAIDDLVGDLEELANPTVGLAAHSGTVDVRITAKAETEAAADELIGPIERTIRQRLGNWVYGADAETLESIALEAVKRNGWTLAVVEAGLGGELTRRLAALAGPFLGGQVITDIPSPDELAQITEEHRQVLQADVGLGVAAQQVGDKVDVHMVLITPEGRQQFTRPYGGPPEHGPRWAAHHSLDVIRKL